jgi:hypothetical protein
MVSKNFIHFNNHPIRRYALNAFDDTLMSALFPTPEKRLKLVIWNGI